MISEDIFDCHNLCVWVLLALNGYMSGLLLTMPQCTGQPSATKNYLAPNVQRLRNPTVGK